MFSLILKTKFDGGRFSRFTCSKSFLLQPDNFTSSAAHVSQSNSEIPNQYSPINPDPAIAFFKNHNFSDTQISIIAKKWPLVFNHVPESTFHPKIEFFRNLGLNTSDIAKILTSAPYLLERSLENQIIPIVDFLWRSLLYSNKDVVLSILRYPYILDADLHATLLHNVGILRFAGVPPHHIATLLKNSPGKIAIKPESFIVLVEGLQQLGLKPQRRSFIVGITVMRQLSNSTWKDKIEFYERVGWPEHQVMDAFRKHPRFMAASTDKITRSLDLLADKMGCDLSVLIKRPQILTMDFDKTLVPRCAFYQVLVCRGLVEQGSLLDMLESLRMLSVNRFVMSYAEKDHELLKMYIWRFLASRRRRRFLDLRL